MTKPEEKPTVKLIDTNGITPAIKYINQAA